MGRLIITEAEKEDILQKYNDDNTDKKILTHLKRHYLIVQPYKNSSFFDGYMKDKIMILIDDKLYPIDEKQRLVNVFHNEIDDVFPNVDISIKRRTIKYYIDLIQTASF
jgi:hypothetical protein